MEGDHKKMEAMAKKLVELEKAAAASSTKPSGDVSVDVGGGQGQLFASKQAQSQNAANAQVGQGQTSESARLQALEHRIGAMAPMVAQHDEQLGSGLLRRRRRGVE